MGFWGVAGVTKRHFLPQTKVVSWKINSNKRLAFSSPPIPCYGFHKKQSVMQSIFLPFFLLKWANVIWFFFLKKTFCSQPVFMVEMKFFAWGVHIFPCHTALFHVISGVFFLLKKSSQCFGNNSQYETKTKEKKLNNINEKVSCKVSKHISHVIF